MTQLKKHRSPPGSFWADDARVEELARLWKEGFSASQISSRMNAPSRNSVISKVARLGLPHRDLSKSKNSVRRAAAGPRVSHSREARNNKVLSPARALKLDGLPIPPPAETDIPRIATVDLDAKHCRFPCVSDVRGLPVDAPIFCGADKVPGTSYCRAHLARTVNLSNPLRPLKAPPQRVMQVA